MFTDIFFTTFLFFSFVHRVSHGNLMMATIGFLKLLLLVIIGCSRVLRADPVISPTVKSAGRRFSQSYFYF